MPPAPKHSRRWFQYSLGTMLLLVTVFGVWLGYEMNWIHSRRSFLADEAAMRAGQPYTVGREGIDYNTVGFIPDAPGLLRFLGERGYSAVTVLTSAPSPDLISDADHRRLRRAMGLFPEAHIMSGHVINGGNELIGEGYMPQYPKMY